MEDKGNRLRLLELIKKNALSRGEYTLSSGKKSSYYIDLRLVTLSPEGAYLVAEVLHEMLAGEEFDAIGGLTLGADPIAAAYSALSHIRNKPVSAYIVRKEEKKHGRSRLIEGPLKKGARVVVVDDVATSGGSLIKAIDALEKEGCEIVKVIALVDRGEGAAKNLLERGYEMTAVYDKRDLGI